MKKNILLVEYSSAAIETIRQMLHHDIFNITVVGSCEEAKSSLGNLRYDLLISEALLPKSHGFTLSKYVSENHPGTKIIIISDKLKKADNRSEAVSKHGAHDFFEKPLNETEFKKRVYELLEIDEMDLKGDATPTDATTRLHIIPDLEKLRIKKEKPDHETGSEKQADSSVFEIELD